MSGVHRVSFMQTFSRRFSVITGFVLLLIALIANALITRHELGVQVRNQDGVVHSRQVLFELAQTESLLKDAETGQRGFLYTDDPRYLVLVCGQKLYSTKGLRVLTVRSQPDPPRTAPG